MSKYSLIAAEFAKLGYYDNSRIKVYELNAALDKIVQTNTADFVEFQRQVALQLFQQTPKDQNSAIVLREYINVMLKAHSALQQHIANYRAQLKQEQNDQKRHNIRATIQQFQQDLRMLTQPFHLPGSQPLGQFEGFGLSRSAPNMDKSGKSALFQEQPSLQAESSSLKWVFLIDCVAILFQILCMYVKDHFLGMMTLLAIIGIYFLNYFDKLYMRVCILSIITSVIFDVIWLLTMSGNFWNVSPTHRSTFRQGYLRFICVMTVILMLTRVIATLISWLWASSYIVTETINPNCERSSMFSDFNLTSEDKETNIHQQSLSVNSQNLKSIIDRTRNDSLSVSNVQQISQQYYQCHSAKSSVSLSSSAKA